MLRGGETKGVSHWCQSSDHTSIKGRVGPEFYMHLQSGIPSKGKKAQAPVIFVRYLQTAKDVVGMLLVPATASDALEARFDHCAMRSGMVYGRINDIKRSHKPVQGILSCLGRRSEEAPNGHGFERFLAACWSGMPWTSRLATRTVKRRVLSSSRALRDLRLQRSKMAGVPEACEIVTSHVYDQR